CFGRGGGDVLGHCVFSSTSVAPLAGPEGNPARDREVCVVRAELLGNTPGLPGDFPEGAGDVTETGRLGKTPPGSRSSASSLRHRHRSIVDVVDDVDVDVDVDMDGDG